MKPPNQIIYNIEKNFLFIEFQQQVKVIVIKVKEVPVKVYNSIRKVK